MKALWHRWCSWLDSLTPIQNVAFVTAVYLVLLLIFIVPASRWSLLPMYIGLWIIGTVTSTYEAWRRGQARKRDK